MALDQEQLNTLVKRVMMRLGEGASLSSSFSPVPKQIDSPEFSSRGIFSDINLAVKAAQEAFPVWSALRLDHRKLIIEKIRSRLRECLTWMSEEAVSETGLGRVDDKVKKNLLVIDKTPGPEILSPEVFTGDDGMALMEYAPFGVLGSITPTTNCTETIINNGISILSAGNTVVFNPHPSSKKVC